MMSEASKTLPPFPSNSDAFKEFQRNSLPPSIPRYQPELGGSRGHETHVIRCHSSLLAFQERSRQRIKRDKPKKKKRAVRKRQDGVSSEGEDEEARNLVENAEQNEQDIVTRRRSTRRAVVTRLENSVMGEDEDEVELSDDEDFM